MLKKQTNRKPSHFSKLYSNFPKLRRKTLSILSEEIVYHITVFHTNMIIDLMGWLKEEDIKQNILIIELNRLQKEIYWIQFFFLHCNYAYIYRSLRYSWEVIYKAIYSYNNCTNQSIKEQYEFLLGDASNLYGWNLLKKINNEIPHINNDTESIHSLWDILNQHVHPSKEEIKEIVDYEPEIFVKDVFNNCLACAAVDTIDRVMDIIYSVIIYSFPEIKEHMQNSKRFKEGSTVLFYTKKICVEGEGNHIEN